MFKIVRNKTYRAIIAESESARRTCLAEIDHRQEVAAENCILRQIIGELKGLNDPKPAIPGEQTSKWICPRCEVGFRFRLPDRCPKCNQAMSIPTVDDIVQQMEARANCVR